MSETGDNVEDVLMKNLAPDPTTFRYKCRLAGLPLTNQRQVVYEVLAATTAHPTADAVYEEAKKRLSRLSRTSVFRILEAFSDHGLIRRIETPGSCAHYDGNPVRHCHTICTECNAIGDWFDAPFDRVACPEETDDGFKIDDYAFTVYGVCPDCQQKAAL